jgi:UDP-3-O-[3-hydroxymyristoyl] glucosamine N-acyltransferase
MSIAFTATEITEIVQPVRSLGSTSETIRNIAPLDGAVPGDLTFLANAKYRDEVARSRASVVLLPSDHPGEPPAGQLWLFLENPSVGLTRLCQRIECLLWPRPAPGIHPSAVVAADAIIGPGVHVGPLCVVESGAKIGEGSVLHAAVLVGRGAVIGRDCWLGGHSVVAQECVLGARVQLQPGAIIGADGYGYDTVAGRHEKIPQIGIVTLGDDVEIGANSTIDRARFSRTSIGEGTKIDNLVHVAHNCTIGRHCLIVAQVAIAGSTTLGDYVVMGGQVAVAGHLKIGSFSKIGGQSGVLRDLAPKSFVNGTYALPYLLEQKFQVLRPRIPELFRRVDRLEAQLGLPGPAKKPSA